MYRIEQSAASTEWALVFRALSQRAAHMMAERLQRHYPQARFRVISGY